MIYAAIILGILLVALALLYWLLPAGNSLHEILHLPLYHYHISQQPATPMRAHCYRFGSHRRQYLWLYLPEDRAPAEHLPVIVYLHGGGWLLGSPEMFISHARFFVSQGYAVAMPSYRRLPLYRAPQIREDVDLAVEKLRTVLPTHGLGQQSWIVGGMSAGANLAGLLCFDRARRPAEIVGTFLCGAPLDLAKMRPSPLLYAYAGRRGSTQFEAASPASYLAADEDLPTLVIQGTHDGLVAAAAAIHFGERLTGAHDQLLVLPRGTHLDAGSWVYAEGIVRRTLITWLADRQNKQNSVNLTHKK